MARVSFIGLGIMGSGMVANLLKSGHQVKIWNRSESKLKELEKLGAEVVTTPALLAEGAARDVVRAVQQARREAKLLVSDRITLTLGLPEDLAQQIAPFMSYIAAETLAEHTMMDSNAVRATDLDGTPIYVGVERLR